MKSQDRLYIDIHEIVYVDYSTMRLNLNDKTMTFESWLTPDAYDTKGCMQTPCKSPWRTVVASDDARDILSSNLMPSLNESCRIGDTSWIHPTECRSVWWEMIVGKSAWSYTDKFPSIKLDQIDWGRAEPSGRHVADTGKVKRYINFAVENRLGQVLVEGWNVGWGDWTSHQKQDVFDFVTPYLDFNPKGPNEYAHSKGVKLLTHHGTSSSMMSYERHSEKIFNLMNQYGHDVVKTGYVGDIIPRGDHHFS